MNYTIKNLRDVDDSAPRFGTQERMESRFARGALDALDTGLTHHIVKPGKRGLAHRHEQAEEVYVVLSGSGSINLDGETHPLKQLDAVRVSPQVRRGFEAGPEGLELLAFGARHDGDGELVDDLWSD
jgi:mannose-6-phosphate isomerase-like protein (cupin superfamily)